MSLTLPEADVLCVYGLPPAHLYTQFTEWLTQNEERFLVILEDEECPPILQHEKIRHCCSFNEEGLKKIAWELLFLEFTYLQKPLQEGKEIAQMEKAFARLAFLQEGIHLFASDFQEKGLNFLKNLLGNRKFFSSAHRAKDLFGKFKGVPAIICGAGPSLDQAAPYLKDIKDQALIFAGGTALSCLSLLGIEPHFGGFIDPHTPSERYLHNQFHQVPLFFQNRVHPDFLRASQGELLWIPGSAHAFFEEESFDGGWNIATFLTAMATALGCEPILLVGVDLKGDRYAAALQPTEQEVFMDTEEKAKRDWIFAKDWLKEFSEKHPQVILDASLENWSFKKQADLGGKIHALLEQSQRGVQAELAQRDLLEEFARLENLLMQMLTLLEKIFPTPPERNNEYILLEIEIEQEKLYEQFLLPIWEIWKPLFLRKIPKGIPFAYGLGINKWLFMKGICDDAAREI